MAKTNKTKTTRKPTKGINPAGKAVGNKKTTTSDKVMITGLFLIGFALIGFILYGANSASESSSCLETEAKKMCTTYQLEFDQLESNYVHCLGPHNQIITVKLGEEVVNKCMGE